MRVLWLSHFLPFPPKGGSLQRSYHLLRAAAERHEVHLVSLNQPALLPTAAAVRDAVDALTEHVASAWVADVPAEGRLFGRERVLLEALATSDPYDICWLRSAALRAHLRLLQKACRFDLLHVDTIGLWPYATEFPGVAAVLNHHNIESHMMYRRAMAHRGLPRRFLVQQARKLERTERQAALQAATNLVVSPLDANRLLEIAPGASVHVVENGTDTAYFRPLAAVPRQSGTLTFVGGLTWYPNLEAVRWLVDAIWPRLQQACGAKTLNIVGRLPRRRLTELERPGVRLQGFVDDVRPFIANAESFLCPIRSGGGTRLKVLDALAMGAPVVATSLAVEGLDLEPDVHFLRADTADDFERQVGRVAGSATLADRLGRNGRELIASRFAWEHIGSRLELAYQAAIGVGRGELDAAGESDQQAGRAAEQL